MMDKERKKEGQSACVCVCVVAWVWTALILTNVIICSILADYNDTKRSRARPRSRGQTLAISRPGIAQRDRITSLLLVWWYMSSLCVHYCINRIPMIYTVGPASLPFFPISFFFPFTWPNRHGETFDIICALRYHNICSNALRYDRSVISSNKPRLFYLTLKSPKCQPISVMMNDGSINLCMHCGFLSLNHFCRLSLKDLYIVYYTLKITEYKIWNCLFLLILLSLHIMFSIILLLHI